MIETLQSTETYKGYELQIWMYRFLESEHTTFHRKCVVLLNGKEVATGKSKKEIKEMIDAGYDYLWLNN